MTIVAAHRALEQGGWWLGTDSLGMAGGVKFKVPKIYRSNGVTYAISGSLIGREFMHAVLRDCNNSAISMKEVGEALRSRFIKAGWSPEQEDGTPPYWDMAFLVTDGHDLWEIPTSMYALREEEDFTATGSGTAFAYGAYHVAKHFCGPAACIRHVLNACSEYSVSCGKGSKVVLVRSDENERKLVP